MDIIIVVRILIHTTLPNRLKSSIPLLSDTAVYTLDRLINCDQPNTDS